MKSQFWINKTFCKTGKEFFADFNNEFINFTLYDTLHRRMLQNFSQYSTISSTYNQNLNTLYFLQSFCVLLKCLPLRDVDEKTKGDVPAFPDRQIHRAQSFESFHPAPKLVHRFCYENINLLKSKLPIRRDNQPVKHEHVLKPRMLMMKHLFDFQREALSRTHRRNLRKP